MDSLPPVRPLSPSSLIHPTLLHHHHHHRRHRHHYHLHASPHCPFHGFMLQPNNHLPTCPLFNSHGPTIQYPESVLPVSQNYSNSQVHDSAGAADNAQVMLEENEHFEEEDEDPIFVLTDEWREFFAKSEAKRKLAKKQAKKKGKRLNE